MRAERLLIVIVDCLAVNMASLSLLWLRYLSGPWNYLEFLWFRAGGHPGTSPGFSFAVRHYLEPMAVTTLYWCLLFAFCGLYQRWKASSRMDEAISVAKIAAIGSLVLFVPHQISPLDFAPPSLMKLGGYWIALVGFVSSGRIAVRTFQRSLLIRGIGRRRALIVGVDDTGRRLLSDLRGYSASMHEIVGFVSVHGGSSDREMIDGVFVVGSLDELPDIVSRHEIADVLIATPSENREAVLDVVSLCNGEAVHFSMVPDLYDIVSGHTRTNELFGVPLVELLPGGMPYWEQSAKRVLDIVVSTLVLIGGAPLWFLVALAIKLDSPGPVFFCQERVGKGGKVFKMYKFRSMIEGAERDTGPIWAEKDDIRVTRLGRIMRWLRLDEVPQFLNVLDGEMSLVGPRPERPYFVEQLARQIPFYTRRLRVKPGLSGWAQTKHTYDESLEDVREKLKYDLYYIENVSLRMDVKILLRTVWVVLTGKGAH